MTRWLRDPAREQLRTGTGVAKDVMLDDALPFGDGIDWGLGSVTGIGGLDPTGLCSIVGSPSDRTFIAISAICGRRGCACRAEQ